MGWSFPLASSYGSDFNFDFNASITEEQQREGTVEYNYQLVDRRQIYEAGPDRPVTQSAAITGTDTVTYTRQAAGMSAFALGARGSGRHPRRLASSTTPRPARAPPAPRVREQPGAARAWRCPSRAGRDRPNQVSPSLRAGRVGRGVRAGRRARGSRARARRKAPPQGRWRAAR